MWGVGHQIRNQFQDLALFFVPQWLLFLVAGNTRKRFLLAAPCEANPANMPFPRVVATGVSLEM